MNRSEVTLSILTDYSKAFDTIDHNTLLEKLQNINFVKNAIKIICSYLIERYQYVQIEDKKSSLLPMFFGVPQGSILGPVLFNLYVAELADRTYSKTIQYADGTTLYRHCKISTLHECVFAIQKDVEKLLSWSQQNNLIFNCDKLQSILFSSSRLSSKHNLEDSSLLIRCSRQSIQQKANVKLLGVIFDQHLTWIDQINNIIRSTHGTLRVLRKFSRFTPMKVRKTLAKALILPKINYCNVVYSQLPKYLINRLQGVQNTTAGYVYGQYAKTLDVINLNWPPIEENIEMNTVKLAHKSLNNELWPNYLKLALIKRKRNLQSSDFGPNKEMITPFNSKPQFIIT